MLDALKDSEYTGEALWIEVTATFRKHTIEVMPRKVSQRWTAFLLSHGLYVMSNCSLSPTQALINCLYQETFVPTEPRASAESQSVVSGCHQHEYSMLSALANRTEDCTLHTTDTVTTRSESDHGHNACRIYQSPAQVSQIVSQNESANVDGNKAPHASIHYTSAYEPKKALKNVPSHLVCSAPHGISFTGFDLDSNLVMRAYQGRYKFNRRRYEDLSATFMIHESLLCLPPLTERGIVDALRLTHKNELCSSNHRLNRLGLDVFALRDRHERCGLRDLKVISRYYNLSDALTKLCNRINHTVRKMILMLSLIVELVDTLQTTDDALIACCVGLLGMDDYMDAHAIGAYACLYEFVDGT
ncbi:hypothetical protein FGB62_18g47 [Gracilaria domingensis]|nr:hypothetical protein FGB62_18g47 [Gracilaria domingensis]